VAEFRKGIDAFADEAKIPVRLLTGSLSTILTSVAEGLLEIPTGTLGAVETPQPVLIRL
jgi:hypothetical protein